MVYILGDQRDAEFIPLRRRLIIGVVSPLWGFEMGRLGEPFGSILGSLIANQLRLRGKCFGAECQVFCKRMRNEIDLSFTTHIRLQRTLPLLPHANSLRPFILQ